MICIVCELFLHKAVKKKIQAHGKPSINHSFSYTFKGKKKKIGLMRKMGFRVAGESELGSYLLFMYMGTSESCSMVAGR